MLVAKIENNTVISVGDANSNPEIRKPFTYDELKSWGYVSCIYTIDHNRFTQKLVECTPYVYASPNTGEKFCAMVEAVALTTEEREGKKSEALVELKLQRNFLLDKCLWTQAADERAIIGATKAAEWDAYRQAVRDVPFLSADPTAPNPWPTEPAA